MSTLKYWLWLSSQVEVSPHGKALLLEHYGDAEAAWCAPEGDYLAIPGMNKRDAELLERRDVSLCDKIENDCYEQDINIITINDAQYPQWLRTIVSPPAVIYVKGKLPNVDETPAIAVIGTRNATPYGLKAGRKLAFDIVRCGGIVVSDVAAGIDRAAAEGCLLAGGRCIGVMGTPITTAEHIYKDIAISGALVSEYAPGTEVKKHFFRDRNRISYGLARGVVVVEAPVGSNTLLFAAEALEFGREIFAVPGNIDAENSVGTIALLKQGAKPVSCGWDIVGEFEPIFPNKLREPSFPLDAPEPPKQRSAINKEPVRKASQSPKSSKKVIDKERPKDYIDLTERFSDLSDEQKTILAAIEEHGSQIDEIIVKSGLPTPKVLAQLTMLEIKGCIRRLAGRRVIVNKDQ